VPKADLTRRLAVLRRAGVEPASVDLDITALYGAYDAMGVFKEHPNVILIDLGAHSTNLVLVVDGRPQFLRTFLLGSATLEEEVSRELGVSVREGRSRVKAVAGPRTDDLLVPAASLDPEEPEGAKALSASPEDALADRRLKFVKKFHLEVYRSLMGVKPSSPPDRILISGGGALLPDVAASLGEKFGLPVERIDVLDRVDCKDAGSDPAFATVAIPVAVGCGLRMLGHNPLGIELLQDEFAPRNTFDVVRVTAATAVTLLFLVMLGLFFVARQRLRAETYTYERVYVDAARIFRTAEERYLQDVGRQSEEQAKKTVDKWLGELEKDHTRISALRSRLVKRHRDLEQNLGLAKEIPKVPSAVQVMYELYAALSSVKREDLGDWFQIDKMEVNERRLTFTIVVSDGAAFDTVPKLLAKSAYFRERAKNPLAVAEAGARQPVGGKWRGDFELKFKEE
jgi:cell division ATPase FtsA